MKGTKVPGEAVPFRDNFIRYHLALFLFEIQAQTVTCFLNP